MSIFDEGQEAETSGRLSHRSQKDILSQGIAPALATRTPADCVRAPRKFPYGAPGLTSDGYFAYAIRHATVPEPHHASGPAASICDRHVVSERISNELLLKRVSEGEKAAMHIFFARHHAEILRIIQWLVCDLAIANDLVGYVFLDVWRSANGGGSCVSEWIFQLACFKTVGSKLSNLNQDGVPGIAEAIDAPGAMPGGQSMKGILPACICGLSPAHRSVIDALYCRKKSAAEASGASDISHAVARSRHFYARKQLAKTLVDVCIALASN